MSITEAAPEAPVTNPADYTVAGACAALAAGKLSAVELARACLARIAQRDGTRSFLGDGASINAWVRTYDDDALAAARASDDRRAAGVPIGPLDGIPLGLKDIYAVAGKPLTASSKVLDMIPEQDSVVWRNLKTAGMVLLGHTHTHEFALGGWTDQVGNPWNTALSAGGSSGGSAAALAASMVPAATGTDTGGSLRIPSSFCGTSTIKPTRTLTSIDGVIPISIHLDHTGPMARTLIDCSMLLPAMAGPTAGLAGTALMAPLPFSVLEPAPGAEPLTGVRIALSPRIEDPMVSDEVAAATRQAFELAVRLGATVVELPTPEFDQTGFEEMMQADSAAYHEQHREKLPLYRPEVSEILGQYWKEPYPAHRYVQLHEQRAAVVALWERWFAESGVDALIEPTTAVTACPRTVDAQIRTHDREVIALTAFWNWTGFPVVSLPSGVGSASGLPTGVSLIGAAGTDRNVLQVGIDLQERLGIPSPTMAA